MLNGGDLRALIEQGENSRIEFKSASVRPEAVAREIVAFANSHGGALLIGVEDDGNITGIERSDLDEWLANILRHNVVPALAVEYSEVRIGEKTVCAIEVPKGKDRPYQTQDGKYWLRIGSTNRTATKEELSRLFQQAGLIHFDSSPVADSSMESIDTRLVDHYYRTYYEIPFSDLSEAERKAVQLNADILCEFEGRQVATVGGLLMFGRDPQRRLPHASIMFAAFKGNDITDELADKKEVTGTLPELIDKTTGLIELFVPLPSTVEGTRRKEQPMIPTKVIREALVNAVAHRDYSLSGRKIQIRLFRDRLEIISPGQLPNTLTLEKIRYGNSAPRNIFLIKYLDNMRYFDGLGRGIPMIIREMGERVVFAEEGELFKVSMGIAS